MRYDSLQMNHHYYTTTFKHVCNSMLYIELLKQHKFSNLEFVIATGTQRNIYKTVSITNETMNVKYFVVVYHYQIFKITLRSPPIFQIQILFDIFPMVAMDTVSVKERCPVKCIIEHISFLPLAAVLSRARCIYLSIKVLEISRWLQKS